ncbi:GtrA family protein [Paenibacillus elgii]|uniref:GtrA family protein n=1 Tax=Paenibacillus elgii TaxID=189691 RepID=UPI0013CF4D4A|nr:GtrA family protein [Paenibacillus elgii]
MTLRLLFRYGIVGLLGTALHFAALFVLVEAAKLHPVLASALGFVLVLLVSYALNRRWTFQASASGWKPLAKYTVVSVTGLLLNIGLMYLAVDRLHWHYAVGQCLVVVAVPISNFLFNYYWTFREKRSGE